MIILNTVSDAFPFPPSGGGSRPDGLALHPSCPGTEAPLARIPGSLLGDVFCFGDQHPSICQASAAREFLDCINFMNKWDLWVNSNRSNCRNEQIRKAIRLYYFKFYDSGD